MKILCFIGLGLVIIAWGLVVGANSIIYIPEMVVTTAVLTAIAIPIVSFVLYGEYKQENKK